ncbi:type VI secretion system ImpA family N-terminal domain-containing protein [Vibrio hepatarius]|uniref:type VI secretion system ImpA family N-terminal domain-containing protein n=1 Tax=Vibrio hepatarius TaxID=171383 RepID=UPI003734D389
MSHIVILDQKTYTIVSEPEQIRTTDTYQKVRDEINSRFNPLSGGTNWQVVHDGCEQLAFDLGIDLLMSCYLTIAKLKLEGVKGYANGLELINRCLTLQSEPSAKLAKMQKELLDWVNGKALPELKGMKLTHEQLRDLYRSERLCEKAHHWLATSQPEHEVNFEGVGFVLFEHIDKIETQYHTAVKRVEKSEQQMSGYVAKTKYRWGLFVSSVLSISVVSAGWWYIPNIWASYQPQYKAVKEVPTLNRETLPEFVTQTSAENRHKYQSQIVELYQQAIEEQLATSVEQPNLEVMSQLEVLTQLFAEDQRVEAIAQTVEQEQQVALEQVGSFVERFNEARTKMANIALMVKNRQWSQATQAAKSLEKLAISLSPIYARVGYIERLIEEQEYQQAETELAELTVRLNNLSWKVAQLSQSLVN